MGPFASFSDDLMLHFIETYLDAKDMLQLAQVSKAFYCFCGFDDMWKRCVVKEAGGQFVYSKSWKNTYQSLLNQKHQTQPVKKMKLQANEGALQRVRVEGFYSDVLHAAWYCAAVDLEQVVRANVERGIERRHSLSVQEFRDVYEIPGKPVILTDVVTQWPAWGKWNEAHLLDVCGEQMFQAEAVKMTMQNYLTYARQAAEESPFYLFDKSVLGSCPHLSSDFEVPSYFTEDLFSVLGDRRADFRWLIVGPLRSGSTFHIDPNRTSAWNAVLQGRKKWIMFPPHITPPGVFPSADGAEVTSPVSVVEWFLNFYDDARNSAHPPIEFVCHPGEMVFIPHGWWHLVINLDFSIAITQNYVSSANLPDVLTFLKHKPQQVSGWCHGEPEELYTEFFEGLQTAGVQLPPSEKVAEKKHSVAAMWEEAKDTGFSFGF
jgi:hypothetical protein